MTWRAISDRPYIYSSRLADIARHGIACRLSQESRVPNAFDDVDSLPLCGGPWWTAAGHGAATGIAVFVGDLLGDYVSEKVVVGPGCSRDEPGSYTPPLCSST
jgi:hypothetical protein